MPRADMQTVKLSAHQKTPEEHALVVKLTQMKSRRWTAEIVNGLLFKEELPGSFYSVEEALDATKEKFARPGRDTLYYRVAGVGANVVKKTRYIRRR